MFLQSILIRINKEVNSLQLISMLIPSPVSSGNGLYLESHIHQFLRILYMGSPAKIHKVISGMIHGNHLSIRKVLY